LRYKAEPYVIAADIYSVAPHIGRGGWTWYTGSSGWMYRLGMEAILGISRVGNLLIINPCIPCDWHGFKVNYHFGTSHYKINVENPNRVNRGVKQITVDGKILTGNSIQLVDDEQQHNVHVLLE